MFCVGHPQLGAESELEVGLGASPHLPEELGQSLCQVPTILDHFYGHMERKSEPTAIRSPKDCWCVRTFTIIIDRGVLNGETWLYAGEPTMVDLKLTTRSTLLESD
jgi:hypothetical protein